MRRTRKYLAATAKLGQLGSGKAVYGEYMDQEQLYLLLEGRGYYWDSGAGAWQKGEAGQGRGGRFTLQPGLYRLRITCHQDDAEALARLIVSQHNVLDISHFYPNARDGTPEIGRIYITCKRKE